MAACLSSKSAPLDTAGTAQETCFGQNAEIRSWEPWLLLQAPDQHWPDRAQSRRLCGAPFAEPQMLTAIHVAFLHPCTCETNWVSDLLFQNADQLKVGKKQARKSSEDAQASEYARFEKVWAG